MLEPVSALCRISGALAILVGLTVGALAALVALGITNTTDAYGQATDTTTAVLLIAAGLGGIAVSALAAGCASIGVAEVLDRRALDDELARIERRYADD